MNAQMSGKKVVGRNAAIASGIICVLLAASLVGAMVNYTSIISAKDSTIADRDSTIGDLNSLIAGKDSLIAEYNDTISSLNSQMSSQSSQIQTLTSQKDLLQAWLDGNVTFLNAQIMDLQSQLNSSNSQITDLQSQISSSNSTIISLQGQLTSANSQISDLNSAVAALRSRVDDLTAMINGSKTKLQTLVFHVCEKGAGYEWGHLPDVNQTYSQILALDNGTHSVLLLPEYRGHENWTEELAWIAANFGGRQGIPIMLDVFDGGNYSAPTPMLSVDDISAAMAFANVQYLRFAEVVSWHTEHSLPFPAEYVAAILALARANNLKVIWTEWKAETFKAIQTYIKGYEDIVTVSFSTNSGDLEPVDGFMQVSGTFRHWGGSVQAWYWKTRHDSDPNPLNMPISLLIQHALSAKNIGAEILQFEPYWYFFDNGQAKENLRLLETMLA